jgi:hypothetical protein
VLPVGTGFAEDDLAGVVWQRLAMKVDALAVALHAQLLDVRWKLCKRLAVREDGVGVAAEEAGVPDTDQAHERWDIIFKRSVAEVLVYVASAVEELLACVIAILKRERKDADSGRDGVTATDPVPEAESVLRVDTKLSDFVGGGAHGNHLLRNSFFANSVHKPTTDSACVQHGFSSGECLADHNNKRSLRVFALEHAIDVFRINIGEEAERAARRGSLHLWMCLKGVVHEQRPKIAATDANSNDVSESVSSSTTDLTATNFIGEVLDA